MAKSSKLKTRKSTLSKPHVIIDAGPGCGKSTSTIAGLNIQAGNKPDWYDLATDEQKAIWEAMDGVYSSKCFQAFNKSIAVELGEIVPADTDAKTFHSFGFAVMRANGYKTKPDNNNVKYMVKDMMGYDRKESMKQEDYQTCNHVQKLVSLCKNNLVDPTEKVLLEFANEFDIEVNGNLNEVTKLVKQVIEKCKKVEPGKFTYIDFDDMIWLPIVLDMDFSGSKYDLLICDESQDLNAVQHKLVIKSGLRLVCVGDPRQAIYGFRGADSDSMKTLESILADTDRGVVTLPLQTSFRLPKSGVRNVNEFAPDLKALPDAIEGEVRDCYIDEAKPKVGDLVVSRINRNIFTMAFNLLRQRVPVKIQGREFGNQLLKIIKENCNSRDSIEIARATIQDFDQAERARLSKKTFSDKLIDAHQEKVQCLHALTQGCDTVGDMINVIEKLFDQNLKKEDVVLLSTVHRAKGLEADNVWFLEPALIPHPMCKSDKQREQEFNIKFVAETRHKQVLTYVHDRQNENMRDEEEDRLMD